VANPRLNATPKAPAARTNSSFLILPPFVRRLRIDIVDSLAVRGEIARSRAEVALPSIRTARGAVVHDRDADAMVREAERMPGLVLDLTLLVRERVPEELLRVDLNGRTAAARIAGAPERAIGAGRRDVEIPAADVVPVGLHEIRLILVMDPDIRVVVPDTVASVVAHLDPARPPRHLSLAGGRALDVVVRGRLTGVAV